ncbi:MAG: hypothetical protein O2800_02500 [Planctomycetota bacterium]|nr:hypothetical protein [Planctomycetota bacterium]
MIRQTRSVFLVACCSVSVLACPPDFDGDGVVGGGDLGIMLAAWGTGGADLTGDGNTTGVDLAELLSIWGLECTTTFTSTPLAGHALTTAPWFTNTDVFVAGSAMTIGVDTTRFTDLVGQLVRIYLTPDWTESEWILGTQLVDVRGAFQPWALVGGGVQSNQVQLTSTATLATAVDGAIGRGFDLVIDADQSGTLSIGDLVDGQTNAGMVVARDPSVTGPFATTTLASYTATGVTAGFTAARLYYPTAIQSMTARPLVVISHGNGHQYTWYDYLGTHLASYGFVVISHQNNTVPGIETSSTTTLQHTQAIIAQESTVAAGAIANRIDSNQIVWIGHSRGGEGICRAFDRLFDNAFVPTNYITSDIKLLISIAPTDFLGTGSADPHATPFMLLYGSADGDVCGCPNNDITDSFNVYERASGWKMSTYLQGSDHNDFNCCGFDDFTGPAGTAIGRTETQDVAKVQILSAVLFTLYRDPAASEFLWRQDESLRSPLQASTTTVVREFQPIATQSRVIDNFQTNTAPTVSSCGGAVLSSGTALGEGLMQDANTAYTWIVTDPQNGLARGRAADTQRSGVFEFAQNSSIAWTIPTALANCTDFAFVQFRAAQGTRHPNTVTLNGDLNLTVRITDMAGVMSDIRIGAYGGGIERPYQRTGYGTGAGWQSEMETIRLPLADFVLQSPTLNLSAVQSITLLVGGSYGSSVGRLQIDDIMLTQP